MRRALGCLLLAALLIPSLAASAKSENVRDDFREVSYSGNDGSLDWAASWSEIGEGNGASSGRVRVDDENCSNNRCLRIEGLLTTVFGASRKADLSSFTTADLSFDMETEVPLLSSGSLSLQARGNGSNWETLDTFTINSGDEYEENLDVSAYAGADFELRFRLSTNILGLLGGPRVYIDKVEIAGQVAEATTTTSTTTTSSSSMPSSTSTTSATATTSSTSSPVSTPTTTPVTITSSTSTTPTTPPGITPTIPGDGAQIPGDGAQTGDHVTTTTTRQDAPTTERDSPSGSDLGTTTSTIASTTSTTLGSVGGGTPGPPPGSGLRESSVGLLADYETGMMGDLEIEVLGAELTAEFSLAVEAFEAAKVWIAILALVIAAAVVSGMDWRRTRRRSA